MTKSDTDPDMTGTGRHVYGPRHVAALMPSVTRPAFRRRSPAAAQVMIDWPAIVGPAIAAVAVPRGLSSGTLTIACAGPVAMELTYLADELRGRINGYLGRETVKALRFVQTPAESRADSRAGPPPSGPVPAPPPSAVAQAARAVADLSDGPLKDALAALGGLVLADAPADKTGRRDSRLRHPNSGRTTTY
jgi:hypothetical protein